MKQLHRSRTHAAVLVRQRKVKQRVAVGAAAAAARGGPGHAVVAVRAAGQPVADQAARRRHGRGCCVGRGSGRWGAGGSIELAK
eukprot:359814-Chlamydomonas_euryale.AAC.9